MVGFGSVLSVPTMVILYQWIPSPQLGNIAGFMLTSQLYLRHGNLGEHLPDDSSMQQHVRLRCTKLGQHV